MGNSLQDQLLRSGLANKQQARKAEKAKKQKEKLKRHNKVVVEDKSQQLAEAALAAQAEKDRALNLARNKEAEQKAIQAQIRQLITLNRQTRDDAEITFNFTDASKIKNILVTQDIETGLNRGVLAIVSLNDGYECVPAVVAEKIRLRDPSVVVYCNDRDTEDDGSEDEYADFKVPDDLMW